MDAKRRSNNNIWGQKQVVYHVAGNWEEARGGNWWGTAPQVTQNEKRPREAVKKEFSDTSSLVVICERASLYVLHRSHFFYENQDVEFARDVPRPTMAQWKGNGDHNPRPDAVPGSGLAGIYRAFLPSGNLVFNFMYAAASPNGQGDGRLSPMVAMGGRDTAAGGHGQRELGRFALPVSQEINNYRSNVTYHRWHRQNNMDNRGVSNRSDRTKDERVTGQKSARTETAEPEKKKSFAPKGAHGRHNSSADERSGFPMEGMMEAEDVAQEDRKGADMSRAIELTKRPNEMQRAKTNFKRRFLAFNTMQARNSKRRKVMEIMVNLVGHENPFPVDQELLVGVGAALDEAQLQSGDQYAHEVKLMHLEAGFDWGAPLERQLYLVKNALKRHKAPEVRANECKVEDLSEEFGRRKLGQVLVMRCRPGLMPSPAFGCCVLRKPSR